MYQYEYVRLETGGGFWLNNAECEHREIIAKYAADGWRYVGYIPISFTGHGGLSEIDLIFERKVSQE